MKVEAITPHFWTVSTLRRRWTVRATGFGGHLILNSRGNVTLTNSANESWQPCGAPQLVR
jgi:hypothetical protein